MFKLGQFVRSTHWGVVKFLCVDETDNNFAYVIYENESDGAETELRVPLNTLKAL